MKLKEIVIPYWHKDNNTKDEWCAKGLISKLHYEYYCEYYGLHPKDYYELCIVNRLQPEKILKFAQRVQSFIDFNIKL